MNEKKKKRKREKEIARRHLVEEINQLCWVIF